MNKILLLISAIFLLNPAVFSQDKQLSIEDASFMNRSLFPERLSNLQWVDNTDQLTFLDNNTIVRVKVPSMKKDSIFRLSDLNTAIAQLDIDELKRFPFINWRNDKDFYFRSKSIIYNYNLRDKFVSELNRYPKEAQNIDICDENFNVAYTIDNNLFISANGNQIQVTNDENIGIVNGQAVHRVEFGIEKGIFWSPSGKLLAFYHMDETMVTDYPLVDITTRVAEVDPIKYPMAGMTSHEVTLGVYNTEMEKTIFLKTGEPVDQYLTAVSWDPNEKYIYIGVLNRDQNHLKLNQYDAVSGEFLSCLFEEKNEKYVEPEQSLYFLDSKPDQFIWMSERDGFNHLYLYNTNGELLKQLTSGDWVVNSIAGSDPKNLKIYFTATKHSPIDRMVYAVDVKSGEISCLSKHSGVHSPILNKNGKYFVDSYSDTASVREYSGKYS